MSGTSAGAVLDRDDQSVSSEASPAVAHQHNLVLRPPTQDSPTLANRASLGLLSGLERLLTLNPEREGEALEDLEVWLARLLIAVRIAMIAFPFFALLAYFDRYAHPDLVATAVGIAILGGGGEVVLLRKGQRLSGSILLPLDLAVISIVALFAFIGAGPHGRVHGLDGFVPYIMMIAGLAGVGFGLSWRGLIVSVIAGVIWALLPLGRGAIIWNDEGGFLLWFVAGALVSATLRLFAMRLDQAVADRVIAERAAERAIQEHWIHEDIIGLCERLAHGNGAPGDRRLARRIADRARLGVLGDTRSHSGLAEGLADLRAQATELGIRLEMVDLITGEPPAAIAETALKLLESLLGNAVHHGKTTVCELAVRSSRDALKANLSDHGVGFDPKYTTWSPHTVRLVNDARQVDLHLSVQSDQKAGSRWELRWQA